MFLIQQQYFLDKWTQFCFSPMVAHMQFGPISEVQDMRNIISNMFEP